jgi:putative ABC transport system permease protein
MNFWKRAFYYISRKRQKSALMFLIFIVINSMVLGTLGIRDASADVLRSLRENAESKVILEKRQTTQNFTMDDVLEIGKLENVNWINCIWSENYSIPELTPITGAEQSDNLFTVHFQNKVENDSVFEEKIYRLTEGNFPQNNNEIVINQLLAEQNGLKIGDRISEDFLIVGFFLSGTERQQTDKVDTVNRIENQIYGMNDAWQNTESEKLTKIVCYVKEPELLSELADELEVQYGENAYVKADDNTYQKIKLSVKQTDRITLLVLAITLVTGCIVTGLLLSMWMRGRKTEIAVYISLGMNKGNIFLQMELEEMILYALSFVVSAVLINKILPTVITRLDILDEIGGTFQMSMESMMMSFALGIGIVVLLTGIAMFPYLKKQPKEIFSEMEG